MRAGELELDPASREVRLRGARVALSQKEFALLRALVADPTRVFAKEELLRSIWGYRATGSTRTLDSHACRLRQKLGVHGDRFVVNVWGVGYRLVDGPVASRLRARRPALGVIRTLRAKFLCLEGGELCAPRPLGGGGSFSKSAPHLAHGRTRVMTKDDGSGGRVTCS